MTCPHLPTNQSNCKVELWNNWDTKHRIPCAAEPKFENGHHGLEGEHKTSHPEHLHLRATERDFFDLSSVRMAVDKEGNSRRNLEGITWMIESILTSVRPSIFERGE